MSEVAASIQLNVPVEEAWQVVMDPKRLGEWVTIHRGIAEPFAGPLKVGSRFSQKLALASIPFKVDWTVKALDPPYRAVWQGRGPAGSQAKTVYELTSVDDEKTLFNYLNEFKMPGGPLGAIGGKVLVGGLSEREAKKTLRRLKRLVETASNE